MTSAQRQRAFKARQGEAGLVQCNVWVPASAVPELQLLAERLRQSADLSVGPIRNTRTGKLISLRS